MERVADEARRERVTEARREVARENIMVVAAFV